MKERRRVAAAINCRRRLLAGYRHCRLGSARPPTRKSPLLSIVPDGDVLEAELLIPARAIGFIAAGQTVQISYDTFPFEQFGFARGTVRSVSHTLLKPDEIVGPVLLREPSYPVAVTLQRQTVRAHGAELPLEPDLQLQADIVVGASDVCSPGSSIRFRSVWRHS